MHAVPISREDRPSRYGHMYVLGFLVLQPVPERQNYEIPMKIIYEVPTFQCYYCYACLRTHHNASIPINIYLEDVNGNDVRIVQAMTTVYLCPSSPFSFPFVILLTLLAYMPNIVFEIPPEASTSAYLCLYEAPVT